MQKKSIMAGLLLLLFFWIPFLMSCDQQKGAGLWLYADQTLLFSTESGPALRQASLSGRVRLTFYNNTGSDAEITLYTSAAEDGLVTLSAAAGETAAASLDLSQKTEINNGIRLSQDGGDCAYILTSAGLETAAATEAPEILLLQDISLDGSFAISAPLTLSTDGHTLSVSDVISFTCGDTGILSLSGDISAAGFYARAPECRITIPDTLVPENIPFQVAAAALNETALDGTITAASMEELDTLATGPEYVRAAGMTVRLGTFTIDRQITFQEPVSFIDEGITLEAPIAIETDKSGEISLEGAFPQDKILLDAPNCSLLWEDNGPALHVAAQLYSIAAYNGADPSAYVLGGDSTAVPEISLLAADNNYISGDVVWGTGEEPFTFSATVDCAVAPSCLKGARLTVTAPEGYTVAFADVNTNEDGTVNLIDSLGCYFTISNGTQSALFYMETVCALQLPVVCIDTDSGEAITSKEEYVGATVAIESDFSDGLPSLETSTVQIRGRGNSTWEWSDKKPYRLKFSKEVSVLGMEAATDWVLLANFADKSLIRNYVALECAKMLDNMDCYATQYPVDVFVNGEYVGVYTMGEQVEAGSGRLFLREDAGSVNTGFLLEVGVSRESQHTVFSSVILENVGILEPKTVDSQTLTFIQNYIIATDRAVDSLQGYENYIDVPSLIDWFIMTEFSYNADSCFRRSVYMTKSAGEKLKMAQVWDFDLAFGNNVADLGDYDAWANLSIDNGYIRYNWMCRLMEDETFVTQLRDRWNEIKDLLLETALSSIEEGYQRTAPSAKNNFTRWDILSVRVGMEPETYFTRTTYASQIEYLREFVQQRWTWMDEELNRTDEE